MLFVTVSLRLFKRPGTYLNTLTTMPAQALACSRACVHVRPLPPSQVGGSGAANETVVHTRYCMCMCPLLLLHIHDCPTPVCVLMHPRITWCIQVTVPYAFIALPTAYTSLPGACPIALTAHACICIPCPPKAFVQ